MTISNPLRDEFAGPFVSGWLLPAIFCLGAFLRCYGFWVPELWIDEYGTWWALAGGGWSDVVQRVHAIHGQSPFYYLLAKLVTDLLGPGPFSLRLPSVIFGTALLGLVYPLALRLFHDRHAAILAVAAFAVNSNMIWYSQEARPYALALFFSLLSFYFYFRVLETDGWPHRIGYALATATAYYAHYLFGFIAAVQLAHLLLTWKRQRVTLQSLGFTAVLLAFLCLPGIFQVGSLFQRRESIDWVPPRAWDDAIKVLIGLVNPYIFAGTVLAVIFIGFRGEEKDKVESRMEKSLLATWLFFPVLLFSIASAAFGMTLLHPRYLLFAAPAAIFIIAWLMASGLRTGWRKWAPLGVWLALTVSLEIVPALARFGTFVNRPDQRWSRATGFLKTFARDDDLVLLRTGFLEANLLARPDPPPFVNSLVGWPLTAYLPADHRYEVINLPYSVNQETRPYLTFLEEKAAQYPRVWFIGRGPMIAWLANRFAGASSFRVLRKGSFGEVEVVSLARKS